MKPVTMLCPIVLVFLFGHSIASATILTDPAQLMPGNTLVDFESYSGGTLGAPLFIASPLVIGGATFSASGGLAAIDVSPFISGPTASGNVLVPFNEEDHLRIDFATPVAQVGFGAWDFNFMGSELRVYDQDDVLLEFASIAPGGTGGTYAVFLGIDRPENDIAYAIVYFSLDEQVYHPYYGIDNVSFGAIPEPHGLALMALCGLISYARRWRK